MKKDQQIKGFTLVELMVVMAIIAVLSTLILGAVQLARRTATETTNRSNARNIETALEAYYAKNREYPTTSGATVSFSTFVSNNLGGSITLNDSCEAVSSFVGGGSVVSDSTTYTISPYNYNCSSIMSKDVIKNQ